MALINEALLRMYTALQVRRSGERGQDVIEYALFGGLLAALIIAVAGILTVAGSNPLETMFSGISNCIDFVSGGCNPF